LSFFKKLPISTFIQNHIAMKKIIIFCFLLFVWVHVQAVAFKVIEETQITFYNYSNVGYDLSGHIISVGLNTFYYIDSLTLISGNLNTQPGEYVVIGGLSLPFDDGELVLWQPGTIFPNPFQGYLVDYVRWGADGSTWYATQALVRGRWVDINSWVNYDLPINRNNDYNTWGHSVWSGGLSNPEFSNGDYIRVDVNSIQNEVVIKSNHDYRIEAVYFYDITGKLIMQRNCRLEDQIVISTVALKNGIYLIRITGNKKAHIFKVMKN
jgi:hypothetical protein